MNDVLSRLREMQAGDVPVTGGRTLAYVYDSGLGTPTGSGVRRWRRTRAPTGWTRPPSRAC